MPDQASRRRLTKNSGHIELIKVLRRLTGLEALFLCCYSGCDAGHRPLTEIGPRWIGLLLRTGDRHRRPLDAQDADDVPCGGSNFPSERVVADQKRRCPSSCRAENGTAGLKPIEIESTRRPDQDEAGDERRAKREKGA